MNTESNLDTIQRSERQLRALTLLLIGMLLGLALWFGGAEWLNSSVRRNLWSAQYLWQQTAHPLAGWLPASTGRTAVPADHLSAHLWQARALLQQGQWLQAEAAIRPIVTVPDNDLHRVQAEIALARGDYAAAIEQWTAIGAADDLLNFARQASQQQQLERAAAAYRSAYALAAERTVLPYAQFLSRNMGEVAMAETLLRQYITALPTSRYAVSWLRELGALYRQQQAWQQAIAIYSQLVAAAPDSTNDWIQLGWVYYERGNGVESALAQFQQAIALTPQEGDGYYATGTLLSREKRYADADEWYRQAVEREPEQQWWYLSRANALQQAGKSAAALQLYATIQQRFPTFAQGHYQAAWAYRQAEQREQAVNAIGMAVQLLDPQSDSSEIQAAYYARAGQIYEWAGQVQQALTAYKSAERLDPTRQDVQNGLQRLQ